MVALILQASLSTPPDQPVPEAPRIARIEIKEAAEKPEAPAPPPPPQTIEKEARPVTAGLNNMPANTVPGKASGARFEHAEGRERLGLNSPAPQKDVNKVGLLGALGKSSGRKGPGVSADTIINDGLITQSVSGDKGQVVLANPPAGIVGKGSGGSGRKAKGSDLNEASTTLSGAPDFDANANGPLARPGGQLGFSVGSGLSGEGHGIAKGGEVGTLDSGSFSVVGGLDRETVRKTIAAYRNQIRACYEKALLSNPKLSGRIVYTWVIASSGPVTAASISKSETRSSQLESCVLGVVRSMVFAKAPNGHSTTVIYPFVFQAH